MLKEFLSKPTTQLGRMGRTVVFQVQLWSHCGKLLKKNHSGQQAATLAYHTIFGLIPMLVVMVLIFQSFSAYSGIGEKVKQLVYEQLHLKIAYPNPNNPDETILLTDHLDKMVGGVFEGLSKGTIALVSAVIIIWVALALLSTIERAFNNIWHVSRGRSFLQRIINYWALLTLGPLLIGVGIYITTRYTILGELQRTIISHIGPAILSFIVSSVAFFLLYFVLPNTKVKAKAAIWGAVVAALVWSIAKFLFRLYVLVVIPYGKIYGVLGLIPLTVFWIYITWLIVLFGLQLTFTTQHLKSLNAAEIAAAKKTEEYFIANELTAINILREIVTAFGADKAPIEAEVLCSKMNLPGEFGDKILRHLVNKGLIVKTSDPRVGYLPAKEPSDILLSDITSAIAEVSFAQSPIHGSSKLQEITQSHQNMLREYNLRQILDTGSNNAID